MNENRDFVEFVFKVPVTTKQGVDVSGNAVGTGGRRRPDGKIAAQAYDPRPLTNAEKGAPSVRLVQPTSGAGIPPWVISAVEQVAVRLGNLVIEEYAIPAAKKLWREKLSPSSRQRRSRVEPEAPAAADDTPDVAETLLVLSEPEDISASTEIDAAPEDFRIEMSREEAQQHADAARAAFEVFVEHASALRNARIVDDEGLAALTAPREKLERSGSRTLEASVSTSDEASPDLIELRIPMAREEPNPLKRVDAFPLDHDSA